MGPAYQAKAGRRAPVHGAVAERVAVAVHEPRLVRPGHLDVGAADVPASACPSSDVKNAEPEPRNREDSGGTHERASSEETRN